MGMLFALLLVLLVVEYFFRMPFVSRGTALTRVTVKAVRMILSKHVSDHWKEVVMLRYAQEVAMDTAAIALMLTGSVALLVLPALVLDWLFAPSPTTMETFFSVVGTVSMTLVAGVYVVFRKSLGYH